MVRAHEGPLRTRARVPKKAHKGFFCWGSANHPFFQRVKKTHKQLVKDFYKKTFYEGFRIDGILDGSLQEIIFDWCVNSGRWGSRGVQRVLNYESDEDLKLDGIIGFNTLTAINICDPKELFWEIKKARIKYYHSIAKKGKNHLFLEGWLKRIGAIRFDEKK